jgi:hypothetical protein
MAVTSHETTVDGLAALKLETRHLLIQIVSALKGKITSMQDRATQREFLWRYPDRALQPAPYGAPFREHPPIARSRNPAPADPTAWTWCLRAAQIGSSLAVRGWNGTWPCM